MLNLFELKQTKQKDLQHAPFLSNCLPFSIHALHLLLLYLSCPLHSSFSLFSSVFDHACISYSFIVCLLIYPIICVCLILVFSWFYWWIWPIPTLPCQWETISSPPKARVPVSIIPSCVYVPVSFEGDCKSRYMWICVWITLYIFIYFTNSIKHAQL